MNIEHLISFASKDPILCISFFLVWPCLSLLINQSAKGNGEQTPYCYIYSTAVFAVCIPGILSICLWLYSMSLQNKNLLELDGFVYYIPLLSMLGTLLLIKRNISLKKLPWFGELYELLGLVALPFIFILGILHLQLIPFSALWQIALCYFSLFLFFKIGWEKFIYITR